MNKCSCWGKLEEAKCSLSESHWWHQKYSHKKLPPKYNALRISHLKCAGQRTSSCRSLANTTPSCWILHKVLWPMEQPFSCSNPMLQAVVQWLHVGWGVIAEWRKCFFLGKPNIIAQRAHPKAVGVLDLHEQKVRSSTPVSKHIRNTLWGFCEVLNSSNHWFQRR